MGNCPAAVRAARRAAVLGEMRALPPTIVVAPDRRCRGTLGVWAGAM
jgi:hypothetical protein